MRRGGVRFGKAGSGVAVELRPGRVWCGLAVNSTAGLGAAVKAVMAWCGSEWLGKSRRSGYGRVSQGMVGSGLERNGVSGRSWSDMVRSGEVRYGLAVNSIQ